MPTHDIIVIGAGPGGYEAAAIAASRGLKTLLVERDALGGTCLNRGCVPTKCLCRSAEVMETARHADRYGIALEADPRADLAAITGRKNEIVAQLRDGVASVVSGAEIVKGEAAFTGPGTITAAGATYSAPKIIIATGSAPAALPIPGAELATDSAAMLDLDRLPPRLAIIGGGVIGLEFASVFAAFGSEVTVIEYQPEVLPPFDREIAKRLRTALKKRGIRFVLDAAATTITRDDSTGTLALAYTRRGKEETVTADRVLMAVGRRPVVPAGLSAAGVATDHRGYIATSGPDYATTAPGIHAIGDCNGLCLLAHAASAQARAVMGEPVNGAVIPSAVFTMPEAAMAGVTEEQARERAFEVKTAKATFHANGKAMAMGETDGLVKLIASATDGTLLGCHICGPHAADLAAEAALAIASGITAEALAETIHAHPTLSEALREAASHL